MTTSRGGGSAPAAGGQVPPGDVEDGSWPWRGLDTATWHGWSVGRFLLPALVVLLLVVGASLLGTAGRLVGPTEDMRNGPRGMSAPASERAYFGDFRDTAWLPVRDVVTGGNPYDAPSYLERHPYAFEFTYTPAQLTVFAPLAALPLTAAALVWFGLLVVGAVALAALAQSAAGLPRRLDLAVVLGAAVLVTRPMTLTVVFGQTSILAILGSTVALWRRRPDLLTTLGVAAAWLKPQFGIPVAVILLALQVRRPVLWGIGVAALVSLPPVVWVSVNAGGVGQFLASLPKAVDAALNSPITRPTDGTVNPDLGALLTFLTGAQSSVLPLVVGFMLVLGVGTVAVVRAARRQDPGPLVATACGLTTVLLCLPHFPYDLLLLVPALAVSVQATLRASGTGTRVCLGLASLAQALVLIPVTQLSAREFQLALLVLGVAALLAVALLPGSRGTRSGLVGVGVAVVLGLRYVLGPVAEPVITSGLAAALLLLTAWVLLLAVALAAPRPARVHEPADRRGGGDPLPQEAD